MNDKKEISLPSKRIDTHGNKRGMTLPYEIGRDYCTIGLPILKNPYPQHDEFNHRRFLDSYRDRRDGAK